MIAAESGGGLLNIGRDDNALGRFLTYLVEAVRVGEPSITLDVTTLCWKPRRKRRPASFWLDWSTSSKRSNAISTSS